VSNIKTLSTKVAMPESTVTAWRDYLTEVYYALDVITPADEPVRGTLSEARLQSICVSHLETNARKVIRRKDAAKADKAEDFVLLFPRQGPLSYKQRAGCGTASPGDVIALSAAEYYEVESLGWTEHVTVKVPCDLLRARLKWIDDCCASPSLADPAMVPIVSSFALQMMSIADPTTARRLEEVCLDLITVMLDTRHRGLDGAGQPACASEILRAHLHDFLRTNFANPDITVSDAARACRASVRSVQRICQMQNTTFTRELLELRLQNADRLLRSHPSSQIGRTAELCGFSNQAHFAACYRRRFGVTPRETRGLTAAQTPNCGDQQT
jgi:AraC family transcriptional regulator, positive regulator of tynA and feaB